MALFVPFAADPFTTIVAWARYLTVADVVEGMRALSMIARASAMPASK